MYWFYTAARVTRSPLFLLLYTRIAACLVCDTYEVRSKVSLARC